MGSSYDDGLKNADVLEGIDGNLSRYAPSYDTLDDFARGRGRRSSGRALPQALIERTVEASVLTALLRRHGTLHPPSGAASAYSLRADGHSRPDNSARAGLAWPPSRPLAADMERFVALLAAGDVSGALGWLTPWRHPFGLLDEPMCGLLGEAAQRLGQCWETDDLCFAEVSLGLVTLQRVLHEFAPPVTAWPAAERRMLLVPMPGEVHCFGLRMLGIRFQQAGWDCDCESHMPEEALVRRVAESRYDVVGLSAQGAEDEARAAALIARIRAASIEPNLRILLGGSRFAGRPEAAVALGADLAPLPFPELSEALDRLIAPSRL